MKTTGVFVLAFGLLCGSQASAQHDYQGQDKGHAAPSQDIRQPSAAGTGDDICMKWNLSEADLKTCRQQWMEAKTEADRLAVREHYASSVDLKAHATQNRQAGPDNPDNSNACDGLALKAVDKTQCRAEWKSAANDGDRKETITRYKAVAAGDKAGSRQEPVAKKSPRDNSGPDAPE